MNSIRFNGILYLFMLNNIFVMGIHEIVLQRIDVTYVNRTLADANCTVRRISRTDYAITAHINLFKDGLAEATDINIQAYSLHSNEFRLAPFFIKRKICDFMKAEWIYLRHSIQNTEGHFPDKCPMPKGAYYLKDYVLDSSQLPQFPVMKAAMLYVNFTTYNILSATVKIYVTFNQDAKIINKVLSEQ